MSQVRGRENVADDHSYEEVEHGGFHRPSPANRGRGRQQRNKGDARRRSRGGGGHRAMEDSRGGRAVGGVGTDRSGGPRRLHRQGDIKFLTQDDIGTLACSDSSELVRCITENEGGFLAAFSHPPNSTHPLVLKRLIKLLYLLVKSKDKHLASRIIAHVFGDSSGASDFLRNLDLLVRKMPGETREHIKRENPQCLSYLIEIGTFAIATVPQSVMYSFPYLSIKDTVQRLSRVAMGGESVLSLLPKVESLADEFTRAPSQVNPQQPTNDAGLNDVPDMTPPPQHFTELPVLPSTEEVHPYAAKPYLRPSITKGAYTDWEHYLDVQFRLMREDFVAPLRDGIKHYELEGGANKYISEVRVYQGVSLCNPVCLYTGIGFQIRFDVSRFHRVNWEHSKRLIFGSLLCLSCDNFQTIYFATVVKRDLKLLKDGLVTVQFEGGRFEEVFQIDPDQQFVMVESTAYFEAYRHILEGLQRASTHHLTDQLPIFKRYLVDCQLNPPVPIPRYLHFLERSEFRLKEVLDIKAGSPDVVLTNPDSWPPCEHTGLDSSQLCAFRAALTQEVSVIQGPPGTGKTFIGLKIIEALVANRHKSSSFPILVLCYTNHALDQFLEGILKISTRGSKSLNVVRIGGRCKTKSLESCVLKAKIDEVRSQRLLPSNLYKESARLRKEIQSFHDRIERAQKSIDVTVNRDKIFKLPVLEGFIHHHHLLQLTRNQRGREIDIWLELWYVFQEEQPTEQPPVEDGQVPPTNHNDTVLNEQSDSDDEFIDYDAEAYMLEDERILEGEELEFPKSRNPVQLQSDMYASNTHDYQPDDTEWNVIQISDEKRRRRIRKGHSNQPMSQAEADAVMNIWELSLNRRWSLYLYWVNQLIRTQKQLLAITTRTYNELCNENTVWRQEIDAYVIRGADIVGMTTTGAAKYNHILSKLYPKIVIIEEAAEVFEAHVFTSLTPSVQQLIMIGDHKQLRPKANNYNLEKNFELCVSLFERLARNGFPVYTLEVQHRMRPEIASLIRPSIYDKLLDHEDVQHYGHVKGVGADLFFIDHCIPEKDIQDKDRSHSNDHEADFLVALCKYLLKQGYLPSQITLLTMYRGQLLELRKRMRRQDYDGVRVAAVDDFQGEENDIILLSLVRSNPDGKIGFLNIENRICVSLSRAKVGLYVIGNLSMLRDKDNTVWPQILADLSQRGCSGKALPLRCQVHPKSVVMASSSKDFLKCPEGGCQLKCAVRLDCGHSCPRLCHPVDREHKLMKCKQKCPKVLECGHNCKRRCWECKEGCFPCTEVVVKRISLCGHEIEMPCQKDPSMYTCTKQCRNVLMCSHFCQELCSRPCTMKCYVRVEKELPCGHINDVPCFRDVSTVECKKPCDKLLDCDHKCAGRCGRCQRGRLHVRCQSKCGRSLVCGHNCNFPCTPTCPPCMEECNNYCIHSKCQRRCYERCVPCMDPCEWQCEHFQCNRRCGEMCDRPPCDKPCRKRLRCGHPCIGLCGEKCPSKCRICDRDEVCEIFFGNEDEEDARFIEFEECKHIIEVTACDAWMEQADDETKPSEVQFKTCPKCKTQIRKSLRYGNIIKQILEDYENIKEKQLVNLSGDLVEKFKEVQAEVLETSSPLLEALEGKLKYIEEVLQSSSRRHETALPPHQVNNINAQLSYIPSMVKMVKHLTRMQSTAAIYAISTEVNVGIKDVQDDILALVNFITQDFLSDQQKSDIQNEIYRLMSLIKLLDIWCKIKTYQRSLSVEDKSQLTSIVIRVQSSGWRSEKLKKEEHDKILDFIAEMSEKYKVSGLTDAERIEIVEAIGLSKGHWFKCPNGHYYCIGECGGAMEEANCPECGARIGGQSHRLLGDNQLAPEMDGARHAAWSELANMDNFDPRQFM